MGDLDSVCRIMSVSNIFSTYAFKAVFLILYGMAPRFGFVLYFEMMSRSFIKVELALYFNVVLLSLRGERRVSYNLPTCNLYHADR